MHTLPVLDDRPDEPPSSDPMAVGVEAIGGKPRRLPKWLKRPIPSTGGTYFTKNLIGELGLETICESGKCPNRSEC